MRGVMASPALAKAQAAGLAELRDALMSHWPRAGSTPPPATLITSFLGERGCHPFPRTEPALGAACRASLLPQVRASLPTLLLSALGCCFGNW